MEKIGIIIPHYNSVDSCMKLIDSLMVSQQFDNLLIVIIDDKSTEDISELLLYASQFNNIQFIENESDLKGAGVCRNIGLDYIKNTTDWILFADADDYFISSLDTFLFKDISKLCMSDIIYYNVMSEDIDTHAEADRHVSINKMVNNAIELDDLESEINVKYSHFVPWGKIFKNSLIYDNNIRFDEILVANDVMFSMKTAYFSRKVSFRPDVLYCVTKSTGSLTTTVSDDIYILRSRVLINRQNFLKDKISNKDLRENTKPVLGWLLTGRYVYKVSFSTMVKVCVNFKRNDMKIFPPIKKIFNLNKVIRGFKIENKYKISQSDDE